MWPQSRAIGYVRRDLRGSGLDLSVLAGRHGYRIVYTVVADTGPTISGLVVAQHLHEYEADAVVVPGFEHAEKIRSLITELAVLITPMHLYPHGYRWPDPATEDGTR